MLKACFNELLSKYGRSISLTAGGVTYSFMGMLQPVADKTKLNLEDSFTSIGALDKSYAVYYGQNENGGELVCEGSIISADGTGYLVKKCEKYRCGEEIVYVWAIVRRAYEGEAVT